MTAKSLLNIKKTNYAAPALFFDEQGVGLVDTINKFHPKIWGNYKLTKQLDWDENEFNFSSCVADFKKCDRPTYDMMIKTLAFQWEADSIASRISTVVGCFTTSTELWAAWQRVSDQETVHACTYSEIVRNSFEDPREILEEIQRVEESFSRLGLVHKTLDRISREAHRYAAGDSKLDAQDLYELSFMFAVTMFILERVQFMSSFAITFAIVETGLFTPIGKAVQKIAQDELESHCELDKLIIATEMKTERGQLAYRNNKQLIHDMIKEVRDLEHTWTDYLFSEGRSLPGINAKNIKSWVDYNVRAVTTFLEISLDGVRLPKENPLKFMEEWLNISAIQASPQEEDNGQYKVNVVSNDDDGVDFDIDDL